MTGLIYIGTARHEFIEYEGESIGDIVSKQILTPTPKGKRRVSQAVRRVDIEVIVIEDVPY